MTARLNRLKRKAQGIAFDENSRGENQGLRLTADGEKKETSKPSEWVLVDKQNQVWVISEALKGWLIDQGRQALSPARSEEKEVSAENYEHDVETKMARLVNEYNRQMAPKRFEGEADAGNVYAWLVKTLQEQTAQEAKEAVVIIPSRLAVMLAERRKVTQGSRDEC